MERPKVARLQLAQKETFEELLKYLTQETPQKAPHNLRKMCPFLDEEGAIQLKGPLRLSGLSLQAKHTVLPSSRPNLFIMVLRGAYEEVYREGTEYDPSILQQEF